MPVLSPIIGEYEEVRPSEERTGSFLRAAFVGVDRHADIAELVNALPRYAQPAGFELADAIGFSGVPS